MLKLSIVIPVYNEEDNLLACLNAIKRQTVRPFEVIVVDNNSTDASMEIARQFKFVRIVKEAKQGIVHARDRGFNSVRGNLIGRIDADTVLPPNWVERVEAYYKQPANWTHALTGGGYFYNLRLPRLNGWFLSQLAYRMNRFMTGFYLLWGSNMAFPVSLWQDVQSEVCHDKFIHEDLDLAIHLHRHHYPITYLATLRVGVYMKRVWENRKHQDEHLMRWPRTLKKHHFRFWWLSILGNILLKYVIQPWGIVAEGIATVYGRPSLVKKRATKASAKKLR